MGIASPDDATPTREDMQEIRELLEYIDGLYDALSDHWKDIGIKPHHAAFVLSHMLAKHTKLYRRPDATVEDSLALIESAMREEWSNEPVKAAMGSIRV